MRLRSDARTVSVALSLGLHLALFLVAARMSLPSSDRTDLVFVSLKAGGGGEGAGEMREGERGAAELQKANAPAARRRPVKPRPPLSRIKRLPAEVEQPDQLAIAPRGARNTGDPGLDTSGNQAAHNPGGGSGTGEGTGFGDGSGSGSGSGSGDLNLRGNCVYCPKPAYPRLARMRGWEGTVNVDVRLSQDGSVHGAEVVESSGYSILDQAAVDVARKSRFRLPQSEQRTTRGRIAYGFRLTPSR